MFEEEPIWNLFYFPESSFKITNSSEYHTLYPKTLSNIESVNQLRLKTNLSLLPHIFHLSKITSTTEKNQQVSPNKEEKYTPIHLTQNLQRKSDIYTYPYYTLI